MPRGRRSASRELASPPANQLISQSPATRTTRSTRSQSRDMDNKASIPPRKSARATRAASVESIASSLDGANDVEPKNLRGTKRTAELSSVAEGQEESGEDNEQNLQQQEGPQSQSPGAMSGMSGTTALTSYSQQELADLDTFLMVNTILDLSANARRLLLLLTKNMSETGLQSLKKELKIPGSVLSKRLRFYEGGFENAKESYGSDTFINTELIFRKLFGEEDPGIGDFRPDAIIHTANLAVQLKGLLVSDWESRNTIDFLEDLDKVFPTPFTSITSYETQSNPITETTITLALELRSHVTIAKLKAAALDNQHYDPDYILAQMFYEPPDLRSDSLSVFDDYVLNGNVRAYAGIETVGAASEELLEFLVSKARDVVDEIRASFYRELEAVKNGEYVNFDQLAEQFPSATFLRHIAQWSRTRLEELDSTVENQGGVNNIQQQLAEVLQNIDSQIDLGLDDYDAAVFQTQENQLNAKSINSRSAITPASDAGKSLLTPKNVLRTSKMLQKTTGQLEARLEVPRLPGMPMTSLASRGPATAPAMIREATDAVGDDDFRPSGFDDDDKQREKFPATLEEATKVNSAGMREKNKENINTGNSSTAPRRRLIDPQANAERLFFESQNDDVLPSAQRPSFKRPAETISDDDEQPSEDEGFEIDKQAHKPIRRAQAPVPQSRLPAQPTQSQPKRARVDIEDDGDDAEDYVRILAAAHRRQQEALKAMAQASASQGSADTLAPSSTYRAVNEVAKAVVARKAPQQMQTRVPWSEHDSELLLNAIAEYGSKYSTIVKDMGHLFERDVDQVKLKDKARNMKTDFLKAGIMLPANFDLVGIGKKEIEAVKRLGQNPHRREGEEPGMASHDMDGNLV